MSVPPLSKFLPDGATIKPSGEHAVRVEKDGDGVRVSFRDAWGWWHIAHCAPHEIDGRKGYSGVSTQQETPEALRLPGEDGMRGPEGGAKPRGIGPKARA